MRSCRRRRRVVVPVFRGEGGVAVQVDEAEPGATPLVRHSLNPEPSVAVGILWLHGVAIQYDLAPGLVERGAEAVDVDHVAVEEQHRLHLERVTAFRFASHTRHDCSPVTVDRNHERAGALVADEVR
jgi:hypothetical protein